MEKSNFRKLMSHDPVDINYVRPNKLRFYTIKKLSIYKLYNKGVYLI